MLSISMLCSHLTVFDFVSKLQGLEGFITSIMMVGNSYYLGDLV